MFYRIAFLVDNGISTKGRVLQRFKSRKYPTGAKKNQL